MFGFIVYSLSLGSSFSGTPDFLLESEKRQLPERPSWEITGPRMTWALGLSSFGSPELAYTAV
jgi:hypothetical protein